MDDKIYSNSILLIGPMGTGKSTIAKELANIKKLECINLDEIRCSYLQVVETYGVDPFSEKYIHITKQNELQLVQNILSNLSVPSIIDFAAGNTDSWNQESFDKIQSLFKKFENVVLLLPSEDIEESIEILTKRIKSRNNNNIRFLESNIKFLKSPANKLLATITCVTKDKAPQETAKEILEKIALKRMEQDKSNRGREED